MKALSIHSYYASAIACGLKSVELRSWETSHKGNLLICSTKKDCKNKDLKDSFIFGKALAVAELVGCIKFEESHREASFADNDEDLDGLYSWALDNIRPIKPFDVKGQLRLFDVDTSNLEYLGFSISSAEDFNRIQDYWIEHGYIKEKPWVD